MTIFGHTVSLYDERFSGKKGEPGFAGLFLDEEETAERVPPPITRPYG